ncbi:C-C motif chemokine 20 [Sinocyclocheilus anshuiensis]|uniref:C-C motif chemokine 20-like n=1 Tax=Sinocyclocheilus anshuiensis TaxID=1608454 RepID=A0A671QAD1_9TELE|nr:PREDICTED: C-C motif chemokine 20-like [Sinocyclocheilus anshuiensis]
MHCIMSLLTITLISSILISLFPHTPAAYGPLNYACCVKYTRNPLPFGVIKGFIEQSSREVCRIDAIIFFTKNNRKVCASVEDQWVRAALARLRSKITKLTVKGTPRITTAGLKRTIHTTTKSP